jgi:hypothetical protein
MDDPVIHSESWTGPIPAQEPAQEAFLGQPWTPTAAEQQRWCRPSAPSSPATRSWGHLLGAVFLLPLLLLGSWQFAHSASPDALWSDRREWLILWGMGIIGIAIREVRAGIPDDPTIRSRVLAVTISATCAFAGWYPYALLTAHSGAMPSIRERTYEVPQTDCTRCATYYVYQRADGSTIEGKSVGPALPYWPVCTEAQRLEGDYGFVWIRVTDRSPPPAHEIAWPIRREECFSKRPLATLGG